MHGVHYTFIFAMRSRYLCKEELPKKFAGGGNSDTINIETSAIDTIPFVDKGHGLTWSANYIVSRAQEWQHYMLDMQRFATSVSNPTAPWAQPDCEYQLTPVWAIDYSA